MALTLCRPDQRRGRRSLRDDGEGGANGYGTVFEIAKTSTGYAARPRRWRPSMEPMALPHTPA